MEVGFHFQEADDLAGEVAELGISDDESKDIHPASRRAGECHCHPRNRESSPGLKSEPLLLRSLCLMLAIFVKFTILSL